MRLLRSAALILIVLALVACTPVADEDVASAAASMEADIEAVKEIIDRFDAALAAGDADAMAGIYAPDAIRMQNELPAWEGRDAILAGFAQAFDGPGVGRVDNVVQDVVVLEDRAIMRGTYTAARTREGGGEPGRETGKWMSLAMRSADDRWLILWDIWNRDAPVDEQ